MPCECCLVFAHSPNVWAEEGVGLTHRFLLELPQSDNQQQNVEQKQRSEYSGY
jgi:hypothetical protein